MRDAFKCICGAMTVEIDGKNYSMSAETFNKMFPDSNSENYGVIYQNCNHCVNHWGIDLCGCGCGELFGECANADDPCIEGSDRPAQSIETGVTACYLTG
jgi:hypothetical protein